MDLAGLQRHAKHVRFQLGRGLYVGDDRYRVRGYFANRLADDFHHEPYIVSVIERCLGRTEGAFIDVGANVGQTLLKVLAIDPHRGYVGFEPQIECCFFIDQFLKDNALEHAQVIPVALSDTNGMCTLYSNAAYDELASIAGNIDDAGRLRSRSRWVPARVGDELLGEIGVGDVAVIKIDVEGAEGLVLSGLTKTLERCRPELIFEVLPNFFNFHTPEPVMLDAASSARNRAAADDLYGILDASDYDISQLSLTGGEQPIDRFELDDPARFVGTNYLARPRAT